MIMARPRRNFTLDPSTLEKIERYAERYCNGNLSEAADQLMAQGYDQVIQETKKGMAYAAIGAAALLVILVL